MRRLFGFALLLLAGLLLVPAGCKKDQPAPPKETTAVKFELTLPESAKPPEYAKERVSQLVIEGKDYSEPRDTKRTVDAAVEVGKETAKIEFTFWPNTYTKITRTKVVPVVKGEGVKADLTSEDASTPDFIKPIFVPTPDEVVEAMCKLAKVGRQDVVWDIGCGDGRLVIMAVKKFGARKGVGIDIEAYLVQRSRDNATKEGVTDKVEFREANALEIKDFSEASVVLLYLGDFLNAKLKPTLQKTLKPGSRVVSHRFLMGDDWPPDETHVINAKNNSGEPDTYKLHLWTIK